MTKPLDSTHLRLATLVLALLAIGCSPQGNTAKNPEPTVEKKAAAPSHNSCSAE